VSGAYSLSSNYRYGNKGNLEWGRSGWIIEPEEGQEEGQVLGVTSSNDSFLTLEIDLRVAQNAKHSYPCNVVGQNRISVF
jgi:N-carbamoylputrescine amidase